MFIFYNNHIFRQTNFFKELVYFVFLVFTIALNLHRFHVQKFIFAFCFFESMHDLNFLGCPLTCYSKICFFTYFFLIIFCHTETALHKSSVQKSGKCLAVFVSEQQLAVLFRIPRKSRVTKRWRRAGVKGFGVGCIRRVRGVGLPCFQAPIDLI